MRRTHEDSKPGPAPTSAFFLGCLLICGLSSDASASTQGRLELPTHSFGAIHGAFELVAMRPLTASGAHGLTFGCVGLLRAEELGPIAARSAGLEPFLERSGDRGSLRLSAGATRSLAADAWRSTRNVSVRGAFSLRRMRLELTGRTTFLPGRSWEETTPAVGPDSVRGGTTSGKVTRTRPSTSSTDGIVDLRWQRERWSFSAQGGLRFGAVDRASRWSGRLLAERRVAPHLSVIAHAGWSPSSMELGLPARRTGGVALKLGWNEPRLPHRVPRHFERERESFSIRTMDRDQRVLRVHWPQAKTIELSADFTDWQVVPLVWEGDAWEARLPIRAGIHRISLRVNGGPWVAPPGLLAAPDGFGGTTGTICLP